MLYLYADDLLMRMLAVL
uniref:Uncharacterized protein n=1 Tax=Arundo donax TaxID=35708 RepID=A0A0A8ZLN2_ARUDO